MNARFRLLAGFFALGGLAACADGPTGPSDTAVRLTTEATVGTTQTATAGTVTPVAPAVRVKDASGRPVKSIQVRFQVTGGGSVQFTQALTNADGIATSGSWTLGPTAGENVVEALVDGLPAVRFTATGTTPAPATPPSVGGPPPGPPVPSNPTAYDISVRYIASVTPRQQQAVATAIARWRSVITRDLADIPLVSAAAACFPKQPAVNENVDDMLIYVEFVDIDGAGKTLGEAGPCYVRSDTRLPIMGYLKLDAADLRMMETLGTLDDVVLHELGHILGIGTIWPEKNLLLGAGGLDPQFTGASAIAAFRVLGGSGNVPVENEGEEGTRDGHWRETVFGNELMSGYISGTPNPMSALTIASLTDLGYGANQSAASSYALGGARQNATAGAGVALHGREKIVKPKWKVDKQGKHTKLS